MNCKNCGQVMTVHILPTTTSPSRGYCPTCQLYSDSSIEPKCSECKSSFEDFKNSGKLGCAKCYSTFAHLLEPLMKSYQKQTPGLRAFTVAPKNNSLSHARTQEVLEFISSNSNDSSTLDFSNKNIIRSKKQAIKAVNISSIELGPLGVEQSSQIKLRLRVARNLSGLIFNHLLSSDQQKRLDQILLSAASPIITVMNKGVANGNYLAGNKQNNTEFRLKYTSHDTRYSIYTGDEDHFRIDWQSSFSSEQIVKLNILGILTKNLNELNSWADMYQASWSSEYGVITACPAICGSGSRFSAQISVPLLCQKQITWLRGLEEAGFEIRTPGFEKFVIGPSIEISRRYWTWNADPEKEIGMVLGLVRRCLALEKKYSPEGL